MKLIQSGTFKKAYKRLHKNQCHAVNVAIDIIINKPNAGTQKAGDLKGYYVYKFDCVNQQFLLSYQFSADH